MAVVGVTSLHITQDQLVLTTSHLGSLYSNHSSLITAVEVL